MSCDPTRSHVYVYIYIYTHIYIEIKVAADCFRPGDGQAQHPMTWCSRAFLLNLGSTGLFVGVRRCQVPSLKWREAVDALGTKLDLGT